MELAFHPHGRRVSPLVLGGQQNQSEDKNGNSGKEREDQSEQAHWNTDPTHNEPPQRPGALDPSCLYVRFNHHSSGPGWGPWT